MTALSIHYQSAKCKVGQQGMRMSGFVVYDLPQDSLGLTPFSWTPEQLRERYLLCRPKCAL
jgi:hypothetical protein